MLFLFLLHLSLTLWVFAHSIACKKERIIVKIAVVNSDQRMQAVYFNLCKTYDTYLINEFTNMDKLTIPDVLVLPMFGPDDKGIMTIKGQQLAIPMSFWASLGDHTKVFCGLPNAFIKELAYDCDFYMEHARLIEQNAVLTAEGTLCLLIDHTAKSIKDCQVDVIGYGTCGKEIVKWLKALEVLTRIVRRVCQGEPDSISIDEWKAEGCGDVIINTAPAKIIDRRLMESWNPAPLIIDIASGALIDEKDAMLCGIQLIKAKALPAIYAWKSAGNIIAETIREELKS